MQVLQAENRLSLSIFGRFLEQLFHLEDEQFRFHVTTRADSEFFACRKLRKGRRYFPDNFQSIQAHS